MDRHSALGRALMPSLTMLFAVLLSCGCAALSRKGVAVQILCGENLLTNGSFENGTFVGGPRDPAIMELGDKSTAVNGWVVSFSPGPRPHRQLSLGWHEKRQRRQG